MTRFLSHHALGGLHSRSSPPTERSPSRLPAPAGGRVARCMPGVLVSSPSSWICKGYDRWPAAATAWERSTGRGLAGQAGGRRGGGAAGARGRAPELCGALPGLCRLPVAPGSPAPVLSVSASPPALAPAPERGGEPQPGAAVGVCALKDASSRSRVAGSGGGWRLQLGQRRRRRLPESRGEDAESHGALLFLVLLLGHRQWPGVWEPRSGLLDRRLQPGCSEQFLRGGVRAGTVRRGALDQAERGGAGWGWERLQRAC